MKTYKHLFTLAMAGLLAVSCQEDTAINTTVRPAEVGDPVLFGASAEYENANPGQTRTEYSGSVVDGREIIWWVPETDKVQIYCEQASVPGFTGDEAHTSHYTVMGIKSNGASNDAFNGESNGESNGEKHPNWLQKQGENSLSWGGLNEHTFYGIYPSKTMFLSGDKESALTEEELSSFNFSGTTAYGYVHSEQIPASVDKVENGVTSYVAKADMRYAYMVAKTKTTRDAAYTVVDGKVNGVSMNFIPLATALEVTLHFPTEEEAGTEAEITTESITIARVGIKGTGVAGSFSADLNEWDGSSAYNGTVNSGSISRDEIVIRINAKDANGNEGPVTLKPGGNLTFTVFLKPGADLSKLKIGFASDLLGQNTQYKSLESAGNDALKIVALKKNVISNLRLPINFTNKPVDYAHWMEQMNDETPISGISLPGTSNTFSYGTTITENKQYYQSQKLTFDQQWTAGIRAFEIVTDRADNTNGTGFSSLKLQCGKEDVEDANMGTDNAPEITVTEAMDAILAKLAANPYETAMLIFTYQPDGRYVNWVQRPDRRGPQYMQQLMNYVNTLNENKLVQFSPTLKLGTYEDDQYETVNGEKKLKTGAVSTGARGKLMIVVRPNQLDESDYNHVSGGTRDAEQNEAVWTAIIGQVTGKNAGKILVVNGCGTGKDKWGARGYTIDGTRCFDISNGHGDEDENEIMETHMRQYLNNITDYKQLTPLFTTNADGTYTNKPGRTIEDYPITRVPQYNGTNLETQATQLKFGYQTSNNAITCWFQEWQRVVGEHIYNVVDYDYGWFGSEHSCTSMWFESYQEKLSHVKATFDMAISGDYTNYVFINSLDAYLVMNNSEDDSKQYSTGSTYGGGYGDYAAFSTKMNADFYTYVNQRIKEAKAPTGIVLMNFVSNDPADRGAYYLPQLILSNNEFKAGVDASGKAPEEEEPGNEEDGI